MRRRIDCHPAAGRGLSRADGCGRTLTLRVGVTTVEDSVTRTRVRIRRRAGTRAGRRACGTSSPAPRPRRSTAPRTCLPSADPTGAAPTHGASARASSVPHWTVAGWNSDWPTSSRRVPARALPCAPGRRHRRRARSRVRLWRAGAQPRRPSAARGLLGACRARGAAAQARPHRAAGARHRRRGALSHRGVGRARTHGIHAPHGRRSDVMPRAEDYVAFLMRG